jgi:hypothetical protein
MMMATYNLQMSNTLRTLAKKKLFKAILLFSLNVVPVFSTALFQGTFATDNQVALFNIPANTFETIIIETTSFFQDTLEPGTVTLG